MSAKEGVMYRTVEIGDKVTIRSWKSMENEWGLDELGDICIPLFFTRNMAYLCKSEAEIVNKHPWPEELTLRGIYYNISPQMLVGEYKVC